MALVNKDTNIEDFLKELCPVTDDDNKLLSMYNSLDNNLKQLFKQQLITYTKYLESKFNDDADINNIIVKLDENLVQLLITQLETYKKYFNNNK